MAISAAERVSAATAPKCDYVSATVLSEWFACSPQYLRKLQAEGVIEKMPQGFALQPSVVCYVKHLRRAKNASPRAAANVELAKVRARLLMMRLEEKQKTLMPTAEHEAIIERLAGLTLTKLSGWPARIAGADMALRRRCEAVLRELRRDLAQEA